MRFAPLRMFILAGVFGADNIFRFAKKRKKRYSVFLLRFCRGKTEKYRIEQKQSNLNGWCATASRGSLARANV